MFPDTFQISHSLQEQPCQSYFSFTRYSSSFFIRLLTSRIVRPDIPCSFAFSSNSLIEISFLSASSSLISFAPRSSFVSIAFPSFPSSNSSAEISYAPTHRKLSSYEANKPYHLRSQKSKKPR